MLVLQLNYFLYRDVLEILSNSTFFKYRQCLFPWIPTLLLGSALLAPGILFLMVACNQYVFFKNLPSDGNVRDKVKFRAQEYNVTEHQVIEFQLSYDMRVMVLSGFAILLAVVWLTGCFLHVFKVNY